MNSSLKDMHDPFLMKDMDVGTDIILDAIDEGKK
jgi:single-stranded-DNA-specific exonuclease